MIKNIQLKPVRNDFLAKLKSDIKEITNRDETFTSFLKINIRNIYVIKLQKPTKNLIEIKSITSIIKTLCEKLDIDDR